MIKRLLMKIRLPEETIVSSIYKILYFNLFKINTFYVFEYDLNKELPQVQEEYNDFRFEISEGDKIKAKLPSGKKLPRELFINEIDNVRYCVVALIEGVIAHICWLYEKDNPNRWFKLKDDEVCINYAYTFPEYRGMSLFPKAIEYGANKLKEKGYSKILMATHEGTKNTLASYRKIPALKMIDKIRQWFIFRPRYTSQT